MKWLGMTWLGMKYGAADVMKWAAEVGMCSPGVVMGFARKDSEMMRVR